MNYELFPPTQEGKNCISRDDDVAQLEVWRSSEVSETRKRERGLRAQRRCLASLFAAKRCLATARVECLENQVLKRVDEYGFPIVVGRECPSSALLGPDGREEPGRGCSQQRRERHVRSEPEPRFVDAMLSSSIQYPASPCQTGFRWLIAISTPTRPIARTPHRRFGAGV